MKTIFDASKKIKNRFKKEFIIVSLTLIFSATIFQTLACNSSTHIDSGQVESKNLQSKASQKTDESNVNTFQNGDLNLENNRNLWNKKNIVDYNINISASEGGNVMPADLVSVEVRGGKVVSITPVPKVDEIRIEVYKNFDTIDKMFDLIQQGFEKKAKVEVKYNEEFGYPKDIVINNEKSGTDSYIIIKVSKFEMIK